jgi:hypothetical protein
MNDPPAHALETTVAFLRSTDGVKQALYVLIPLFRSVSNLNLTPRIIRHMAADEMRTITSDKWADDVWGVGIACESITRLFFYFGRNDHWVAEQTRAEIMASRGQ